MTTPEPRLKLVDETDIDPFAFEDKGYSRAKHYVRSTDGHGNSDTKYVKVAPSMLGVVGKIVSGGAFPAYRTDGDFIRDAIYHHAVFINERIKDGDIDSTLNRNRALSQLEDKINEVKEFRDIIAKTEESMQTCVESGDSDLLSELIAMAEFTMEELRDNYKEKVRAVVDSYRVRLKGMNK